jgi:Kef-type K+ transport system membrane component KefB
VSTALSEIVVGTVAQLVIGVIVGPQALGSSSAWVSFLAGKTFRYGQQEGLYYTLMMSTGLTFGTISALFGLSHGVISAGQYAHLVAAVIGSAVIPTLIANAFIMPGHLRSPEVRAREMERGPADARPEVAK